MMLLLLLTLTFSTLVVCAMGGDVSSFVEESEVETDSELLTNGNQQDNDKFCYAMYSPCQRYDPEEEDVTATPLRCCDEGLCSCFLTSCMCIPDPDLVPESENLR